MFRNRETRLLALDQAHSEEFARPESGFWNVEHLSHFITKGCAVLVRHPGEALAGSAHLSDRASPDSPGPPAFVPFVFLSLAELVESTANTLIFCSPTNR